MRAMGAKVETVGKMVEVTGTGGVLHQPKGDLDCGNSGSTMRMLAGLVAAQKGTYRFVGDESLTVRPMDRIRKPLELMGARIDLTDGHAPMTVHGGGLKAIDFEAPFASAQVRHRVEIDKDETLVRPGPLEKAVQVFTFGRMKVGDMIGDHDARGIKAECDSVLCY